MSNEFDWDKNESIVIKTQLAIAVYENENGHIVIRQEGHLDPQEEAFIFVAPDRLRALIEALQAYLPERNG